MKLGLSLEGVASGAVVAGRGRRRDVGLASRGLGTDLKAAADRLLFGNISLYKEIPAPMVAGTLYLWDARARRKTWEAKATVARELGLEDSFNEVRRVSELGFGAAMIMPTAETLRFVRRTLSTLPALAPAPR